jgi:hypothetical protein
MPNRFTADSDFLYQIDLEKEKILKIRGSPAFLVSPISYTLPVKGIAGAWNPPPKESAALWFSKREESLYMFGGFSNYRNCFGNDFWMYNISFHQRNGRG